jgi:hypothetical protein
MAKAPHVGSRMNVAAFVHDKVLNGSKELKVIQPEVLSFFNDKFWWVAKIITIDPEMNVIGIARKTEYGFVIVSEDKKGKYKIEGTYMNSDLPVKVKDNVVSVERKRR